MISPRFKLILTLLCLLTGCATVPAASADMAASLTAETVEHNEKKEFSASSASSAVKNSSPRATWEGETLFSYASTAGNKNTIDTSFFLRCVRHTPRDRLTFKAAYDYGTTDRELSKRASLSVFKYDRNLNDNFYSYVHTGLAMNHFTGLELRTDTGAGAGWHTYTKDGSSLRCELGFNYANEDYRRDFPPRLKSNVNYTGARIAMVAETRLSKYLTFYHLDEFVLPFDNANYWRYHSHLILTVQLNEKLSLKAGLIFYHDRRAPKHTRRSDSSILAGLGYKF